MCFSFCQSLILEEFFDSNSSRFAYGRSANQVTRILIRNQLTKPKDSTTQLTLVCTHGLRTPGEEIAFTAWPKIKSQSQIHRYDRRIGPKFQVSSIFAFIGCPQSVSAHPINLMVAPQSIVVNLSSVHTLTIRVLDH